MKALKLTMVKTTEPPVFTKFNCSGSTQAINKYAYNLMPDGGKYYEKKQKRRMMMWGSDSGVTVRTTLDRRGREEISIKVTFEKRPKK